MKQLKHIALLILFISCEKNEFTADTKTVYPYEPEQETIIDVKVVPVGDVVMEFKDMDLEVNADYFNRYGIGIRLYLQDRVPYPQGESLPNGEYGDIMLYVVPMEYINMPNVAAYAVTMANGYGNFGKIILGENYQTNRTLAHEIGHILNLRHFQEKNNVMTVGNNARQYGEPNQFNEAQVDTMLSNVHWYEQQFSSRSMVKDTILIID